MLDHAFAPRTQKNTSKATMGPSNGAAPPVTWAIKDFTVDTAHASYSSGFEPPMDNQGSDSQVRVI